MAYDFKPEQAHPVLTKMQARLNEKSGDKQAEVKIANALIAAEKNQHRLVSGYLDLLRKEYFTQLFSLDFGKAQETANFINNWVAGNTNDRIKDIVDAEQVEQTHDGLFQANAIYFNAKWSNQFEKHATREDIFYTSSAKRKDESKRIEMMQIQAHFLYADIPGYQLLEMPYEDSEYAMLFVLPDNIQNKR